MAFLATDVLLFSRVLSKRIFELHNNNAHLDDYDH